MKVIGLIAVQDAAAFDEYRTRVGATVERHGGRVAWRGRRLEVPWNELGVADFEAFVELEFPSQAQARQWAASEDYAALLPVRRRAMRLTLFMVGD